MGVGVEVHVCRGQEDDMVSGRAPGRKSLGDWGGKHAGVMGALHGGGHGGCGRMRGRLKLGLRNLLGSAPKQKNKNTKNILIKTTGEYVITQ